MPQPLSDDEFSNQFGGGFRAAPSPVGMSGRFGAAVDRTQASLLGIGEAAGLPLGGLRRENQGEADASMQRYYRETGAPRSFSEVGSAGDFGSYVAGLATDSVPAMGGILAGGLVGGPMGAFAAGAALGTGDVLDNQREQAGTTNLASALPLGMAYGAADSMLGVGGMLARRSLSTGIKAVDRAGVDLLDGLTGMKGIAARAGVKMLKTGAVEAGSETFQEGTNQLGRMSVDPTESFYNERSAENFKESAIGGGLLGGLMGGAAGGWTRSKGFQENAQRDLLAGQEKAQVEQVQTQQYGLQREQARAPVDANLAGFFPEAEPEAAAAQRRKAYMQQFGEAAGAPSGEFVADPVNGLESQLDMGQMFNSQVPLSPEEQIAKAASDASYQAEQKFQQRAAGLGVPPKNTAGLKALRMLEDVQGEISPEEYGTLEGILKAGQFGTVTDALNSREKAFKNHAKAREKAQTDALKAEQRATEKAQKEATRVAEKEVKDAERATKAATPTAAEVAQQADTDNAPKAPIAGVPTTSAATETVAPKSPSVAKLRQKVAADKAARVAGEAPAAPEVTVSDATVGGVAVQKVAYVEPTRAKLAEDGGAPSPRDSATHVETLLRGSRADESARVAADYEAFKTRLSAVTGFYLDTDGDTGATVLRQDRNPIPMAEVAATEGVTRAAISKQFNVHGVSDKMIGALASVNSDVVEDTGAITVDGDGGNETGSDAMGVTDAAAEEIDGRISGSAAKATGAGRVAGEGFTPTAKAAIAKAIAKAIELGGGAEVLNAVVAPMQSVIDGYVARTRGVETAEDGVDAPLEPTANEDGDIVIPAKEQKAARQDEAVRQASRIKSAILAGVANQMAAAKEASNKQAPPTAQDLEFDAKRKAAVEESNLRELAFWLRTGDGRHVAQWWDDRAKGVGTDFENLPDVDQVRWARGVFNIVTSGTLTDGKFDGLYLSIAKTPTAGAEVQTGESRRAGAPVEAVGGRRDAPAPAVTKKRVVRDAQGRKINADVLSPDTATAAAINRDVIGPGIPNVAINSDVVDSFATGSPSLGGVGVWDGNKVVANINAALPVGGTRVNLVATFADLPQHIQNYSTQHGVTPDAFRALISSGNQIFVTQDTHSSEADLEASILHEVYGHAGLRTLFGATLYGRLNKLYLAVGESRVDELLKEYGADSRYKEVTGVQAANAGTPHRNRAGGKQELHNALLMEELMAHIAAKDHGSLKQQALEIIGAVKSWLRGRGYLSLAKLDMADIAHVLKRGRLAVNSGVTMLDHVPMFSAKTPKSAGSKAPKPPSMQQFSDSLPGRVADLWDSFKTLTDEVSVKAMFTQDLVNRAAKVLPSATKYLKAMVDIQIERGKAERVVADVVEDFRALPAHERGLGPRSVNAFLKESTMTGKWAFAPSWVPGAVVDPALKARFEGSLSPKAQELVKRVFQRGHDSLVAMQTAAVANADSEYNALIAEATKAGDAKEVAALTSAKAKSLKDFQGLLAIHKGTPYAPLKRFGNYVVMAVSQEYKAASEAGDSKRMQEMQRDGDHYHIEFTDTNWEARARTRVLKSAFPGGFVGKMEKGDDSLMMGGRDMLGAFGRLRKVMADSVVDNPNVDKATGKRIDDMMRQLYLTLLSETSARKGEIHRKNVAGANDDMMRAFATQGRATAHFIAGLKTSGKVDDHLAGMRNETEAYENDREERTRYYNEIVRRHSLSLEYKPSPMIDQAMAGTSAMMLLTNPSYHLMNALQPGMMTIPVLAGRHGYAKSWAALTRAYTELGPILKAREFTEKSYSALPADVRQAIEDLANMGKIDIMLDADLGRVESASDNAVKRPFVVASEWLKGISQDVESMNRLSSAIAAFRLEKGRPGTTHEQAVKYASEVIYETHGDYSGFNAPRFMRSGMGRLMTQFKKFQLIQISMFARLASRSWRDDPAMTPTQNAEAKTAARYALTYTLAHLLAMGGAMGLPGFAAIAWVVGKVWPGDDEPDDPEATLRRAIGNDTLADFLLQGVPAFAGVNMSGRIGAGGMLSLLPYTDVDLSRKSYPEMVVAAMGPFIGGVLPRASGGLELMRKGELVKGTEALLPNGLGNALKAARFGTEGVSKGNGDNLMSPDDLNALDILGQAFGLPTTKISDRTTENASQYKAEQFYKDRTGELKQRYTKAAKSNDADTLRDLRTEWTNTQAARKELGFKPSPLSDLLKAPQEQRKREAATAGGVQFNKGNKGFREALQ